MVENPERDFTTTPKNNTTMKKIILLLTVLTFNTFNFAQDCEPYIPMEVGTTFEHTSYSPKGKPQSTSTQKIISKKDIPGGMEAEISSVVKDDKGKDIASSTYVIRCENGNFYIDLKTLMGANQMAQYSQMEMSVEGDFMELPSNPSVGQKLEDASLKLNFASSGIAVMSITIEVTNRRITAKESRTTPAGTYDCFVFEQDVSTTMGGMIPMNIKSGSKEWYAKGVGMVRSENYNQNGKMDSYSELTSFSK